METADRILLVVDGSDLSYGDEEPNAIWPEKDQHLTRDIPVTLIRNKCDIAGSEPSLSVTGNGGVLVLSAKTGAGLDLLRSHLKQVMGFDAGEEGTFSARRRHLHALDRASSALNSGMSQLLGNGAGELLAEDLRLCQQALGEITGTVSSDELLGEIFSSFCIGK